MWKNTDTRLEIGNLLKSNITKSLPKHGPVLSTFVHRFNFNNGTSR